VLSHYRASWLRADALAGVAVAAYLVPQVMAYAVIAGVAPAAGLWSAVVALLAYALVGTSRQLSVGPESTTALMTAATVAPLAGGDPVRYAALASCLALLVGGMCVLGRFVAAGALADLLSTPVLVGYLAGISVTMIVGQVSRVTGVPVSGESVPAQLRSFAGAAGQWHWPTVVVAAGVFALLWAGLKLRPNWPIVLLGLLTATVAVALFGAADAGVALVGAAATGLPRLGLPLLTQGDVGALLLPALGVALVGYSDNVLTARAFSRGQPGKIDNDQELSALGIGNLLAGLVHGMPISSSASRTAVGVAQGSRTQLYSLVAVGVVVLAMSAGGSLLAAFPVPALGAIVAYAAIKLIDLPAFRRIARLRISELLLALATTGAVLAMGVLNGVLVAVGLSFLDLIRRLARPHDAILGYVDGIAGMHALDDYPQARPVPGLLVYRYDAPLCFANAEDFRSRALAAVEQAPSPPHWLLLDAEAILGLDSTAAEALRSVHDELTRQGVVLAMARVKQELRRDLVAAGLLDRIGEDRVFMTLPTAVADYRRRWPVSDET
jgi:high affinity sulfate transporter 1